LISPDCIKGWTQNQGNPEVPVCLDVFAGGKLIAQTLANRYREDLEQAGLGSGRHSFAFTPPAGFALSPEIVEVRRSLDGAIITLTSKARTSKARTSHARAAARANSA
jgi:hypothetical protein